MIPLYIFYIGIPICWTLIVIIVTYFWIAELRNRKAEHPLEPIKKPSEKEVAELNSFLKEQYGKETK